MMRLMFLAVLSSLPVIFKGQSDVIGSQEQVKAVVGDDVILPCHLEPPFDVKNLTVEWTCNKNIVHLYRSRKDDLVDQDQKFEGRTSLFNDEMTRGNISLKLTNVTEQDAGNYTCYVPKLNSQDKEGHVTLIVEKKPERDGRNQKKGGDTGIGTADISVIVVAAVLIVACVIAVIWRKS